MISKFVLRFPLLCMFLSLVPSILTGVLLFQQDPIISIDTGFSQFRVENDESTYNLDRYNAATNDVKANFEDSVTFLIEKYNLASSISIMEYKYDIDGKLKPSLNALQKFVKTLPKHFPTTANHIYNHLVQTLNTNNHHHNNSQLHRTLLSLYDNKRKFKLQSHTTTNDRKIPSADGNNRLAFKGLVLLYWNIKEQTLLTENHFKWIREVEDSVQDASNFDLYCATESSEAICRPPNSVLNYLYPSVILDENNKEVTKFDGRGTELVPISSILKTLASLGRIGFFGLDFDANSQFSTLVLSEFSFGNEASDKWFEQFIPLLDSKSTDEVRIVYYGGSIFGREIFDAVIHDAYFAIGSLLFIFIYIIIYIRSLFLSICGLLGIILSFLPALYFQRIIFGEFMSLLNVLALWLIAGIGADDIFIYYDTWKQSDGLSSLRNRFRWTYKEAVFAMLVTSFTTAAAFLGNMVSLIPAIRQFGFFLGILVLVNYYHIITWFPCCVIFHEKYIQSFCDNGLQSMCDNNIDEDDDIDEQNGKEVKLSKQLSSRSIKKVNSFKRSLSMIDIRSLTSTRISKFMRKLHELLDGRKLQGFSNSHPVFKHDYKTRYFVLMVMVAVIIFFSINAMNLRPPQQAIQLLPLDSNLETARSLARDLEPLCGSCTYPFGSDGIPGLPNEYESSGVGSNPSPSPSDPTPQPTPQPTPLPGTPSISPTESPTPAPTTYDIFSTFPLDVPKTPSESISRPSSCTNFQSTLTTLTSISLSWNVPSFDGGSNILFYTVVVSVDQGVTWNTTVYTTSGAVTSVVVELLKSSQEYTLVVVAANANGYGTPSDTIAVTTATIFPPSITMQSVTTNLNSITFSWSGSGTDVIYTVFLNINPTNPVGINVSPNGNPPNDFISSFSGASTSFTKSSLCGNDTIYYYIRASNVLGIETTLIDRRILPISKPSTPAPFTLISVNSSSLSIKLNAPNSICVDNGDPITHYNLYYSSVSNNGPFTLIGSFNLGTIVLSPLVADTACYYKYASVGATTGESEFTEVQSVTTSSTLPDAPVITTIVSQTATIALISWTSPTYVGASSLKYFQLEVAANSNTNPFVIVATPLGNTNNVLINIVEGTSYFYRLKVNNTYGFSAYSSIKSFTAPIVSSPPPENFRVTSICQSCPSILVNWSAVINATQAPTQYFVQVSIITSTTTDTPSSTAYNTIYQDEETSFNYLTTFGEYYIFRIASDGGFGQGSWSSEIKDGNFTSVPKAPNPPTFSDIDYFNLTLTWSYPVHTGGTKLLAMEVQYSIGNLNNFISLPLFNGTKFTTLSYRLDGLPHNTPIYARSRAFNKHGNGTFSTISVQSTNDFPCPGAIIKYPNSGLYGQYVLCNDTSGTCNTTSGTCDCIFGVTGRGCNKLCPGVTFLNQTNQVTSVCTSQGTCAYNKTNDQPTCICDNAFTGTICDELRPQPPPPIRITPSRAVKVWILFGITDVSLTREQKASIDRIGTPIWDTNFDLPQTEMQVYMDNICNRFLNGTYTNRLWIQVQDSLCVMSKFKSYLIKHSLQFPQSNRTEFTFHFGKFLLTDGVKLQALVGLDKDANWMYVGGEFIVSLLYDNPASTLLPNYDKWREVFDEINSEVDGMTLSFGFHASDTWPRIRTEQEFINGVIFAASFAIGCAGLALILFTGNLYLSFLSSIILGCIILCLAGFFNMNNMTLGPVEAISFSMVVGLGVDYSLHISHQFVNQASPNRYIRSSSSMFRVGGSILSASITTVGSTIILLLTKVQIFKTFGIIACATAVISVVLTLVLYVTLLSTIGPQDNCCDLIYICCPQHHKRRKQQLSKSKLSTKQISNHKLKSSEFDDNEDNHKRRKSLSINIGVKDSLASDKDAIELPIMSPHRSKSNNKSQDTDSTPSNNKLEAKGKISNNDDDDSKDNGNTLPSYDEVVTGSSSISYQKHKLYSQSFTGNRSYSNRKLDVDEGVITEEVADEGWNCLICEYFNIMDNNTCLVCAAPRNK